MQKHWYAIYAYPGYEHRVKAALIRKIREKKIEDFFGEILVPTEKVMDLVHGAKRVVERRMFPGYLLVDRLDRRGLASNSLYPKSKGTGRKGKIPDSAV